ncbi:MAG: hypothetical protein HON76_10125 [Candidatus Scalindua sp.]|nr:hypothetical protein [Candidatus Scalindua sp.]
MSLDSAVVVPVVTKAMRYVSPSTSEGGTVIGAANTTTGEKHKQNKNSTAIK